MRLEPRLEKSANWIRIVRTLLIRRSVTLLKESAMRQKLSQTTRCVCHTIGLYSRAAITTIITTTVTTLRHVNRNSFIIIIINNIIITVCWPTISRYNNTIAGRQTVSRCLITMSAAPQIWNHIPTAIRASASLDSFKRHLKTDYFASP